MSLEVTPEALYREVEAARVHWERCNMLGARMISRYTTPAYHGSDGTPAPENYHYLFTLHTMARLTLGRIEPRFTSKRREASERVRGLEDFCRRWVHDTNWESESERCKLDMCFYGSGVAVFRQKPRRGYEQLDDPPNTPQGLRLPPGMWFCDPLASCYEEVRHAEHVEITFKNDLIAEAEEDKTWDLDAIKAMVEAGSFANSLRQKSGFSINRKEVVYYCIWVPGYELPDSDEFWKGVDARERKKYHGTVFTLGACAGENGLGSEPRFIRKPQGYFGPRQGPYCFAGFLSVPDQVRKLSPLVANDGLIEQLNAQERSNDRLAENAKTLIFVDALTPDVIGAIERAKHGQTVPIPGFDKTRFAVEVIGGPQPESILRGKELRSRVARNLSIPDIASGEVTGTGTATENALAGENMDMTADFLDRSALSIDEQMILRVAWCADQDDSSVVETDSDVYMGGSTKDEKLRALRRVTNAGMLPVEKAIPAAEELREMPETVEGSFDDLEIRVERVRSDPQSRAKLTEAWNLALQVGGALPVLSQYAPGVQQMMERSADELGVSELAAIFDPEAAAEFQQEQQELANAPAEAAPRTLPAPKPATASQQGGGFKRAQPGAGGAGPKVKVPEKAGAK